MAAARESVDTKPTTGPTDKVKFDSTIYVEALCEHLSKINAKDSLANDSPEANITRLLNDYLKADKSRLDELCNHVFGPKDSITNVAEMVNAYRRGMPILRELFDFTKPPLLTIMGRIYLSYLLEKLGIILSADDNTKDIESQFHTIGRVCFDVLAQRSKIAPSAVLAYTSNSFCTQFLPLPHGKENTTQQGCFNFDIIIHTHCWERSPLFYDSNLFYDLQCTVGVEIAQKKIDTDDAILKNIFKLSNKAGTVHHTLFSYNNFVLPERVSLFLEKNASYFCAKNLYQWQENAYNFLHDEDLLKEIAPLSKKSQELIIQFYWQALGFLQFRRLFQEKEEVWTLQSLCESLECVHVVMCSTELMDNKKEIFQSRLQQAQNLSTYQAISIKSFDDLLVSYLFKSRDEVSELLRNVSTNKVISEFRRLGILRGEALQALEQEMECSEETETQALNAKMQQLHSELRALNDAISKTLQIEEEQKVMSKEEIHVLCTSSGVSSEDISDLLNQLFLSEKTILSFSRLCCLIGKTGLLDLLLQNVTIDEHEHVTLLHTAMESNQPEVVRYLLQDFNGQWEKFIPFYRESFYRAPGVFQVLLAFFPELIAVSVDMKSDLDAFSCAAKVNGSKSLFAMLCDLARCGVPSLLPLRVGSLEMVVCVVMATSQDGKKGSLSHVLVKKDIVLPPMNTLLKVAIRLKHLGLFSFLLRCENEALFYPTLLADLLLEPAFFCPWIEVLLQHKPKRSCHRLDPQAKVTFLEYLPKLNIQGLLLDLSDLGIQDQHSELLLELISKLNITKMDLSANRLSISFLYQLAYAPNLRKAPIEIVLTEQESFHRNQKVLVKIKENHPCIKVVFTQPVSKRMSMGKVSKEAIKSCLLSQTVIGAKQALLVVSNTDDRLLLEYYNSERECQLYVLQLHRFGGSGWFSNPAAKFSFKKTSQNDITLSEVSDVHLLDVAGIEKFFEIANKKALFYNLEHHSNGGWRTYILDLMALKTRSVSPRDLKR